MADALKLATYLEGFYVSEDVSAVKAREIASTLRKQHAEIARLRALSVQGEPVAWRPNVACVPPQHFNAGQPSKQDVAYWASMGRGIEYAYKATAPRAFSIPEPGTPWWQTAKDCGAWTDKPDGDVGYVHFGSIEALRVYTVKITKQAQVAAPAAPAGWQPIETAPRDGSLLMLWEAFEDEPFIGHWLEFRSRWAASTTHYDTDGNACVTDRVYSDGVTHWMPLPAAPSAPGAEGGE